VRASSKMCVRVLGVGVPDLAAVDDEAVALPDGRVWMREVSVPTLGSVDAERHDDVAGGDLRQVFCFSRSEPCLMTGIGGNT